MTEQLSLWTKEDQTALSYHETVIERGLETFIEVGQSLTAIRESRLYRQNFETFEEYCREKWGKSRHWANRLIKSTEIAGSLNGAPGHQTPTSEKQIRPLSKLTDPDQQAQAWSNAVNNSGGKPTAKDVQAEVDRLKKELAIARTDNSKLKRDHMLATTAYQEEFATRKQTEALLVAQRKTEAERIQAAKMAVQEEAEKKLSQETQALEARLANMENELDQLQKNPSPEMEAAIADLAQKKRLLANELAEATEQRNQITARLKDLRDEFTRQEELNILAKNYLLQVEELFDKYSRLQVADLSNEAIAAIQTANQGLLKLHNQMNKAVGDASKIVHMRPVEQPIEVEAL